MKFTPNCTKCPRLAGFLAEVRRDYPDYRGLPVSPFGDDNPRLLIVGLAPGMHGANRTGRPFTGDHAGILLYQTLHRFGFSNQAEGVHFCPARVVAIAMGGHDVLLRDENVGLDLI